MRPSKIARSKDVTTDSTEEVKKAETSKRVGLKPWESKPYKYEEPEGPKKLVLRNPRWEYVEQAHGLHQDDFTPFNDDGDYGYGPSVFSITTDLSAHASFASDLGTLAGAYKITSDNLRKAKQELVSILYNDNKAMNGSVSNEIDAFIANDNISQVRSQLWDWKDLPRNTETKRQRGLYAQIMLDPR
jgi:hypothetical protein